MKYLQYEDNEDGSVTVKMNKAKRGWVEPVTRFNERVIYGCDRLERDHDQKWAFGSRDSGYVQRGQVAVQVTETGEIVDAKLFKTVSEAYAYNRETLPSQGIMA